MKLALEQWRHWLEGSRLPFMVWTDHKNLEYITLAKRLNSRQAQWALFFTHFNFSLSYRPGSRNGKPDTLSRQLVADGDQGESPEPILRLSCVVASLTMDVEERFRAASTSQLGPSSCPNHRHSFPQA